MTRLPDLARQDLDDVQAALFDRISGGPRGKMGISLTNERGGLIGPFNAYLYTPELGARLEAAGVALREHVSLSPRHREIAILTSARHHEAQFEWFAHAIIGERAGVPKAAIEAIHAGEPPAFESADDAAVHAFARELLEHHRVSDATFEALGQHLTERQRVELVFVLGYYALVSFTLNTFRVPVPDGVAQPFPGVD
jgi:4-carboxymuconolactone decarboxylase